MQEKQNKKRLVYRKDELKHTEIDRAREMVEKVRALFSPVGDMANR